MKYLVELIEDVDCTEIVVCDEGDITYVIDQLASPHFGWWKYSHHPYDGGWDDVTITHQSNEYWISVRKIDWFVSDTEYNGVEGVQVCHA